MGLSTSAVTDSWHASSCKSSHLPVAPINRSISCQLKHSSSTRFSKHSNVCLRTVSAPPVFRVQHRVGVQASQMNLEPFKINGLIMIQPFFGGVERSDSELRLANDMVLPLPVADLMWELALPVGADRDHEYCNPLDNGVHRKYVEGNRGFPRCYISGHVGDPLIDRQMMFGKLLEEFGVCVVKDFTEDGFHGCESFVREKARELIARFNDFIHSSSTAP